MTSPSALRGLLSALLLLAITIASSHAAIVTLPAGLNPGDQYRLVFVTDRGYADPIDVDEANDEVTAEAIAATALNDLGTNWTAIVSNSGGPDAIDHTGTTGTGVAIFGLDGLKVADNYLDFWDGTLDAGISLSPTMADQSGVTVMTGTETDGFEGEGTGAGGNATSGIAGSTTSAWIANLQNGPSSGHFYGISGILTAPAIPEPSRALLGFVGLAAIILRRRR